MSETKVKMFFMMKKGKINEFAFESSSELNEKRGRGALGPK